MPKTTETICVTRSSARMIMLTSSKSISNWKHIIKRHENIPWQIIKHRTMAYAYHQLIFSKDKDFIYFRWCQLRFNDPLIKHHLHFQSDNSRYHAEKHILNLFKSIASLIQLIISHINVFIYWFILFESSLPRDRIWKCLQDIDYFVQVLIIY